MKFVLSVFIIIIFTDIIETCNIIKKGLSEAEKKEILKLHNDMRQNVASGQQSGQPKAANMNVLTWDDGLAAKAQQLLEKCDFNHDSAGQNLYWGSLTEPIADVEGAVVDQWYNEVNEYGVSKNILQSYQDNDAGHYTQVVWAETKAVGCGFTAYPDTEKFPGNIAQIIACNYAPHGNFKNKPVYEFGNPCSKCKNGCSKSFPALCA